MTAFARVEQDIDLGTLSWELRTVNHRYLEISFRLPEDLRVLEPAIRQRINKRLSRGKVDVGLRFKANTAVTTDISIDRAYVEKIVQGLTDVQRLLPQPGELNVSALELLKWPGVIQPRGVDPEPLHQCALSMLDKALDELVASREREGEKLKAMLLQRCAGLTALVEAASLRLPEVLANVRLRLKQRFDELQQSLDAQRLEQEIVLVAQKMDVAEELDRLQAHLSEMNHILAKGGSVGRRLDFLMQEFNREANTLGAKSADVETTRLSVDMKVLIEQMREQIQNIE